MKFESHWPKGSGGVNFIHDFLFLALAAILFIEAKPFLAILVEDHLSNIPMKFLIKSAKWYRRS